MGLFSGGFGTGLVEGLATSVDQSLRDAMDKRDKELSRARQFWETRQAQKMDLADEHDARADKALGRLIEEFGGNVAKGLAAYKAMGNDVDAVEAQLKEVDLTRANLPGPYSLEDKFTFEGIDFNQFADLSREDAKSSIIQEVKPIDAQTQTAFRGRGLLNLISPGSGDIGKVVSEDVNSMVPARTRTAIEGLSGAAYDRSGTFTQLKTKMELENLITSGTKRIDIINRQVSSGKNVVGGDLTAFEKERLIQERAQALATLRQIAVAEDTSDDEGRKTSALNASYARAREAHMDKVRFKEVNGRAVMPDPRGGDAPLQGNDAVKAWNDSVNEFDIAWITTNLLDANGEVVSSQAQGTINENMLMDQVALAQERIQEAKSAEGKGKETIEKSEDKSEAAFNPVPIGTGDTVVNSQQELDAFILNSPSDYVRGAIIAGKALNPAALEARLRSLGVAEDAITEALALLPAEYASEAGE